MSKFITVVLAAWLALLAPSGRSGAQTGDTTAKRPLPNAEARDSLFLRARQLVLEGNGAAGRAVVDSAVTATVGTPEYATALYWHAALAATAADAERDYRRVIVEYPFSPHAGDALLALAQLEMARGDREPAIDHLQRFLLQRPNDPERIRAGIWLGRLLLDVNQPARGCAVLLRTRASLGDTAVEVRNQVDYYAGRCVGVDTTAPPPRTPPRTDTVVKRDSARSSTRPKPNEPKDSAAKPPPPRAKPSPAPQANDAGRRFTVQVAAYDTRDAAEQLIKRLATRGITARIVDAGRAPYRVRVGRYATDADATVAARELKSKGIEAFVTTTDNETAPPRSRP